MRAAALDWASDTPPELKRLIIRMAQNAVERSDEPANNRLALLEIYEAFGRWDAALALADELDNPTALCRVRARQAVELADTGQRAAALRILRSLDPLNVRGLSRELHQDVGEAYRKAMPNADTETLREIEPELLRDAALAAFSDEQMREGDCARAVQLAAAMSWDGMRISNPREEQLMQVAVTCLRNARPGGIDTAVEAADEAVGELKNLLRQIQVHYEAGQRLLELGRREDAAERVERIMDAAGSLTLNHHRAEGLAHAAALLAGMGRNERARGLAGSGVELLPSIGCSSCIYSAFEAMIPLLVEHPNAELLHHAILASSDPRTLSIGRIECVRYALAPSGTPDRERASALRAAALAASRQPFAADRCEGLVAVAEAYLKSGFTPGDSTIAIVRNGSPARPRPTEATEPPEHSDGGTARLVVFTVENCPDCARVKQLIENYRETGRYDLEIAYYDLDAPGSLELNDRLCQALGVPPEDSRLAPSVFSAVQALVGDQITEESLEALIAGARGLRSPVARYAGDDPGVAPAERAFIKAEGGRDRTAVRRAAPGRAHLTFFSKRGCSRCRDAKQAVREAADRLDNIEVNVRTYYVDEQDNVGLNLAYLERHDIEGKVIAPSLFSSRDVLVDREITAENVLQMARAAAGQPSPEQAYGVSAEEAQRRARGLYENLTLGFVLVAGLADGAVNPCAITVIIFFIAYLTHVGQSRKQIFVAGTTFVGAVFVTYFLLGLGLLSAFTWLASVSRWLSQALEIGAAIVLLVLAALSFRDAHAAARGELKQMSLALPERFQSFIRRLISNQARTGLTLGATLVLGAIVALVELPCTSLLYIPVLLGISWAVRAGSYGLAPYLWIFLYNLAFILPLVGIFAAVYLGITSEQLARLFRRHIVAAKIILGLIFLGLALLLFALPGLNSPPGRSTPNSPTTTPRNVSGR
jgi:cytochrome c biogenesis protein CcdA/glutaredoxin